jgi:hypothetical protein
MDDDVFHWIVTYRIAVSFLLVFFGVTVYGGIGPCVQMGPGVARCESLCGVPWGTTQVLYTSAFVEWDCLPGSVKVRDYLYRYSPVDCSDFLERERMTTVYHIIPYLCCNRTCG